MGSSLVLNRRPKVPAEDTAAFGAIAERFRRAGALEQAVSLCRDGLRKFPDHVSARVTLGWSLLDLGKYDEARVELEQVMRRAPDNLAAIRGLAELHDRFEHTLNLPMDGPGQWPPPAESVDDTEVVVGDASVTFEAGPQSLAPELQAEPEIYDPPVASVAPSMVPPEMGLPLWSPEPVASAVTEAVANTQIHVSSSGMSSVREIDALVDAAVPVASTMAEPPVPAADAAVDRTAVEELGVTDAALAALIAEADAIDVLAPVEETATAPSLELADVDLSTAELDAAMPADAALESTQFEFAATEASPVDADPVLDLVVSEAAAAEVNDALSLVTEPVVEAMTEPVVELAIEPAIEPVVELAIEPAIEPAIELAIGPAIEPVVELAVEPAIEPAIELAIEPEVEPAIELAIEPAIEPAVDLVLEPVVESAIELAIEPVVQPAIELVPEAAGEPDVVEQSADVLTFVRPVEDMEEASAVVEPYAAREAQLDAAPDVEPHEIDAELALVSPSVRKGQLTIAALERMLARVHTRRTQLMAESVA